MKIALLNKAKTVNDILVPYLIRYNLMVVASEKLYTTLQLKAFYMITLYNPYVELL